MSEVAERLVAFADSLADASRPIALRHWRRTRDFERKGDESPVTVADRAIEQTLRDLIERHHPDHGIAGEEFGGLRTDARHVCSIDPIDGTRAFVSGSPLFGTLIALVRDGTPVLGIIDIPALDERWKGAGDGPATLNGKPVGTRRPRSLGDAILGSTSPLMFTDADAAVLAPVRERVGMQIFGGDCYLYGLLALGTIDLVIEAGLSDYDYLAGAALIHAAGGVMTDWQGRPLGIGTSDRVVAAGDPAVHAEVISLLGGAAARAG